MGADYRDAVIDHAGLPVLRQLYELNGAGHTAASLLRDSFKQHVMIVAARTT